MFRVEDFQLVEFYKYNKEVLVLKTLNPSCYSLNLTVLGSFISNKNSELGTKVL